MLTVAPAEGYDSLTSLDYASNYHADLNNPQWLLAEVPTREAALRRGTQYLLAQYQPTRYKIIVGGVVAVNAQQSVCELALRALSGQLFADVAAQQVASEKVDVIAVTYTTGGSGQTKYAIVDALMAPLASAGKLSANQIWLERG